MKHNRNTSIPEKFRALFWEYDPESIDIVIHRDLIIGRIVETGSWASMKWLVETYSKNEILSFLENRGKRILPLRDLNYWLLIAGVSSKKRAQILNEESGLNNVWSNRYSY